MTSAQKYRFSATWNELSAQPQIWTDWEQSFDAQSVRDWVKAMGFDEVWFSGAGTSAYIGDILAAGLHSSVLTFRSVPSTDLVACPSMIERVQANILIVNFGRSGDSAESRGVLQVLDALAPNTQTLNITCNPNGALANARSGRVILLPEACHDRGFAMTSSFTTMLLTAAIVFAGRPDNASLISKLATSAEELIGNTELRTLANATPDRVVYVGSGPLTFAARECALKVLELSSGKIPALWDSTLGFRHGPKSFVTDDTAIHVLGSSDPHTSKYDKDLVSELRDQYPNASVAYFGVGGELQPHQFGSEMWESVLHVLIAQVQSVIWSDRLGINIDDPFVGQSTLSRVVSDVQLYRSEASI